MTLLYFILTHPVAPLVGAWIERSKQNITSGIDAVAPLVGAWIERYTIRFRATIHTVAPLVGAWIERTPSFIFKIHSQPSLLL